MKLLQFIKQHGRPRWHILRHTPELIAGGRWRDLFMILCFYALMEGHLLSTSTALAGGQWKLFFFHGPQAVFFFTAFHMTLSSIRERIRSRCESRIDDVTPAAKAGEPSAMETIRAAMDTMARVGLEPETADAA